MIVYPFTKFSNQLTGVDGIEYRAKINEELSRLRAMEPIDLKKEVAIQSDEAKGNILRACGLAWKAKTARIYEIDVGGKWRLFVMPSSNKGNSVMVLMIGHLEKDNSLDQAKMKKK